MVALGRFWPRKSLSPNSFRFAAEVALPCRKGYLESCRRHAEFIVFCAWKNSELRHSFAPSNRNFPPAINGEDSNIRSQRAAIRRCADSGIKRSRGSTQTSRHVHREHVLERSPPPGLRSSRQLNR